MSRGWAEFSFVHAHRSFRGEPVLTELDVLAQYLRQMNLAAPSPESAVDASASAKALTLDVSVNGFRKGLCLLVLIGLVTRAFFFVEHARSPSFGVPTLDQTYYDTVARMLLAGADLHTLHGFRPLLYPAFLALWYRLGGAWGVDLALLVQHCLGVATGVLVALLAARTFRHRFAGLCAGALYLLAPVPLYFEGELLIEPSYTFLICLGLLLALKAFETPGWKGALLWAVCGGLTILTSQARANILIFLPAYALFAVWQWVRQRRLEALTPLMAFAGALAMAIPWGWVNMKQMDHFHLLPNAGGVALYLGNKRTADGMVPEQERRITSGEQYEDSIEVWAREEYERTKRAQGQQPDSDPMAISHYWTARALDEIKAAPDSWLTLMAKKTWLTFWNVEVPNNKAFAFLQTEFSSLHWLPVRWVVLLVLTPVGLWAAWKRGSRDGLLVIGSYSLVYSIGNIIFFICDRYRYPVWPAMAVFAGGGLVATFEILRQRRMSRISWVLLSMVLLAIISLHNWFGARLPTFARDYLFRSLAWYQKGHFEEALSDVQRSIALDPADANALHHRANVLFGLNRLELAREAYVQTLQVIPEEAGAWNNLGATLDLLGRRDEALAAFKRATECQPPSKNAFLGMAFVEIKLGHLAEAAGALDQLERLDPQPNASVLATRSVLERRVGHINKADELAQRARALDADAAGWAIEAANKP